MQKRTNPTSLWLKNSRCRRPAAPILLDTCVLLLPCARDTKATNTPRFCLVALFRVQTREQRHKSMDKNHSAVPECETHGVRRHTHAPARMLSDKLHLHPPHQPPETFSLIRSHSPQPASNQLQSSQTNSPTQHHRDA